MLMDNLLSNFKGFCQAFIWDRCLIPSSQKSGMKMSQTLLASRWILWHPSASEVAAAEETIYPTSTRDKLLISAVTHGGVHLFRHRPDHFTGHSRGVPVCW